MNINEVTTIFFSPTKSTKKIVETIATVLTCEDIQTLDITLPSRKSDEIGTFTADIAVIGVPVYSGRVPLTAVNRLKEINVKNVPAIIIVVYGNRHYDDALLELHDLSVNCGFKPIAAGAFIAEHSFSLEQYPIAKSRPDKLDLGVAKLFGNSLVDQYKNGCSPSQLIRDNLPGNYPFIARKPSPSFTPETDETKCGNCRKCVMVCPTDAISKRDNNKTETEICILCGACIKVCENGARSMKHPSFINISKHLSNEFNLRKEPELFIEYSSK